MKKTITTIFLLALLGVGVPFVPSTGSSVFANDSYAVGPQDGSSRPPAPKPPPPPPPQDKTLLEKVLDLILG